MFQEQRQARCARSALSRRLDKNKTATVGGDEGGGRHGQPALKVMDRFCHVRHNDVSETSFTIG